MYSFSPKLRLYSIIFIALGLVLFGAGYFMNKSLSPEKIEHMMEAVHAGGNHAPTHSSEMVGPQDHEAHLEHATMQVHNQPLAAIHTVAVFLFALSCCALFFYCIQNAAHAGWPIIILRVMEAIASYIPWGGAILIIIMLLNVTHQGHLFHWMDSSLTTPGDPHFDPILYEKKKFLNIPFYAFRTIFYVVGASFFAWKLKSMSKKVDESFGKDKMMAALFRMKMINSCQSLIRVVKKWIEDNPDKRFILFTGDEKVGLNYNIPMFNSKSKNNDVLKDFQEYRSNSLCLIKKGGTGVTYEGLDTILITDINSNSETLEQRCGRSLLFEEGKESTVHIFCSLEEFQLRWLENSLKSINPNRISYKYI